MKNKTSKSGFTLVELLVVIGIIALLISILLPVMAKARRQAVRTQCASNLRQLAIMATMYATQNKDYVPIAVNSLNKQSNFWFYNSSTPRGVMFGQLWESGVMGIPQIAYCPAQRDDLAVFNTSSNKWPYVVNSTTSCRTSYSMRGDYRLQMAADGTTTVKPFLTHGAADATPTFGTAVVLPKLRGFKGKAIFCDLIRDNTTLVKTHQDGINFVRADGSAGWLPKDACAQYINTITPTFASTNNPAIDAIFDAMDAQ